MSDQTYEEFHAGCDIRRGALGLASLRIRHRVAQPWKIG